MKVHELMEALSGENQNAEVFADGCDCTNPVVGLEENEWREVVIKVSL